MRLPKGGRRMPNPFEHAAVTAHFYAGNRVQLTAVDAIPLSDPENGDAEDCRRRGISVVARWLKRGNPSLRVYVP